MKSTRLKDMNNDALLQLEKSIKILVGVLIGALLVLLIIGIAFTLKRGFNAFIIIPFALLPIVLVNANSLKEIKKELSSRSRK
ncbi:redox-active disulfide protein 2 [Spirosoma knui]